VGYPDIKGREAVLKIHCRNKPLGPDVNLGTIAKTTVGFTPADLENLVNEAALLAARKDLKAITMTEIKDATIKVVMGPEKRSHVVKDFDKMITSYHEAGHALCFYYCATQDPVHEVSIIKRGMAGGYTMPLPADDRGHITKTYMFERIVVAMGGRVAEQLVMDDISTGASQDLQQSTEIARQMVTRYGFSEKVGPIVYGGDQDEVFLGRDYGHTRHYSEEIAAEIDKEVRELIEKAYKQTTDILDDHLDQLHLVSKYLYEHEKIDAEEFLGLMNGTITVEGNPFATISRRDPKQLWDQPEEPILPPPEEPTPLPGEEDSL
jgi:cell division protease FtsH